MALILQAISNQLRSLADDLENHVNQDILQFRLDKVTDDLARLNADMNVEVDQTVFDSLEEAARLLGMFSEPEEVTHGRPSYILPPNIIEAHLLWGHAAGDIAQVFGVCERTIRRRMVQYGIR